MTEVCQVTLWEVTNHMRRQVTTVLIPVTSGFPSVLMLGRRAFLYAGRHNYEEVTVCHLV